MSRVKLTLELQSGDSEIKKMFSIARLRTKEQLKNLYDPILAENPHSSTAQPTNFGGIMHQTPTNKPEKTLASEAHLKNFKKVLSFEPQKHSGESACAFKNASCGKRKHVLAFDIDQTLNVAKTPIPPEIAEVLKDCLDYFEICPISGQKFDQFIIQIVDELRKAGATDAQLTHLHLFVAQGTQYYRYDPEQHDWKQVYNYPLPEEDVVKITTTLQQAAEKLGFWEANKLKPGDEIIENRLSQVTFSALGQTAGTEEKYAWDPDCKKRAAIVAECQKILPDFLYEIGGTTSINVAKKGMNKEFGMTHLLEELKVEKSDVLYFGDMTQPGGNDYPVVQMGIDTITVRSHEDTLYALRGILGLIA